MGKVVSQLLAEALIKQKNSANTPKFKWISRPMRSHVNSWQFTAKKAANFRFAVIWCRTLTLPLCCCSMAFERFILPILTLKNLNS